MNQGGYPDGCSQQDHDRAFGELSAPLDEDEAYNNWLDDPNRECVWCGSQECLGQCQLGEFNPDPELMELRGIYA